MMDGNSPSSVVKTEPQNESLSPSLAINVEENGVLRNNPPESLTWRWKWLQTQLVHTRAEMLECEAQLKNFDDKKRLVQGKMLCEMNNTPSKCISSARQVSSDSHDKLMVSPFAIPIAASPSPSHTIGFSFPKPQPIVPLKKSPITPRKSSKTSLASASTSKAIASQRRMSCPPGGAGGAGGESPRKYRSRANSFSTGSPRTSNKKEYDINNIVVPRFSGWGVTEIPVIEHKEILTPKWHKRNDNDQFPEKEVVLNGAIAAKATSSSPVEAKKNEVVREKYFGEKNGEIQSEKSIEFSSESGNDDDCDLEEEEDLSENAFALRHYLLETEERKYLFRPPLVKSPSPKIFKRPTKKSLMAKKEFENSEEIKLVESPSSGTATPSTTSTTTTTTTNTTHTPSRSPTRTMLTPLVTTAIPAISSPLSSSSSPSGTANTSPLNTPRRDTRIHPLYQRVRDQFAETPTLREKINNDELLEAGYLLTTERNYSRWSENWSPPVEYLEQQRKIMCKSLPGTPVEYDFWAGEQPPPLHPPPRANSPSKKKMKVVKMKDCIGGKSWGVMRFPLPTTPKARTDFASARGRVDNSFPYSARSRRIISSKPWFDDKRFRLFLVKRKKFQRKKDLRVTIGVKRVKRKTF